jgi:hypothetical protein
MGCCQPAKVESETFITENEKILEAIKVNSSKKLEALIRFHLKRSSIEAFDLILLHQCGKTLNALGLCAVLGYSELFELLLNHGSSIRQMEEHFVQQNISLLEIICTNGYSDLLSKYFPYYLEMNKAIHENHVNPSFHFTQNKEKRPIILSVEHGHLKLVQYFWDYFKGYLSIPSDFNVHSLDEVSGENSAFIACREGHYEIVTYLYQTCEVDFSILNNSKESTLMVTVAGMQKKMTYSYIDITEYLIETAGVDVTYNYEELLISAQLPSLVSYLESKLKEKGIVISKKAVDKTDQIQIIFRDSSTSIGTVFTPSILNSIQGTAKYSQISSIASPRESEDLTDSLGSIFWYAR